MKFLIESSSPAQIFALQALIHSQPGWRVVGSLHNPGDILAATGRTHPDVIILDLDGEALTGDLLNSIRAAKKTSALIILGTDPELRRQVDLAGAGLFFNKAYSPESLLAVLAGCETTKPEKSRDGLRLA
jgi:DNA-binding NarL/FixJ family response regulator